MANLSKAYESAPQQTHRIIPLDFQSVKHVPESHSWSNSDDSLPVRSQLVENIEQISLPVIDLGDLDASKMMGQACESWGMFQVINHGIPSTLFRDVESEARAFFSLAAEEKMKALRSPGGLTGYGVAQIAKYYNKLMWHEGLTIVGSPMDHVREIWPDQYHRFCEVMEAYQKAMKELSERLLDLILKSLGMPEEHIEWLSSVACKGRQAPSTLLQLNSYPPCPDPTQATGLAPHTDSFLITILHQVGNINGLQVHREGTGWALIVPLEGALVVNVGDMLHIMSNGLFSSVLHRAVVDNTRHRLSFAYFYGPPAVSSISPIPRGCQSQFRSMTVREYLEMKGKDFEGALSKIRVV
ncbi:gibberellin 3-beta-dioxygenase 1-like [Punica granatum]|uniref:gibberellin 3beta-dioxygenase n=2 Tax=Punica granatum TaxID=22663 RepID=A0A218WRJ2_PUNGR|nr:gibberellin 3-beta-dioxygenase 1-like [Punica granatum]OWM75246.1 hypothetical protein CDL15_Pgr023767 [Punica granatum]PKI64088.1 hypothetical protein CRG98_015532 [Punica granatum]